MTEFSHTPVLVKEVLKGFKDVDKGFIIDATFGLGGYSRAILENTNCKVFGLDRDPDVEIYAKMLLSEYKDRFSYFIGNFSNLFQFSNSLNLTNIIGITFDLGISSLQIENSIRGFSFKSNGPLDMRMSKKGKNVETFLKDVDEETLKKILKEFGEEKYSSRISKAIINEREKTTINSTLQLAKIIRKVVPGKSLKIDKATKSFQALRMHINNELEELKYGLIAAENILKPNGILAVVSFHSLEDRLVKKFITKCAGKSDAHFSKFLPPQECYVKSFEILTKKPIMPSLEEIEINSRSRSAKLRLAKRTSSKPLHEIAA